MTFVSTAVELEWANEPGMSEVATNVILRWNALAGDPPILNDGFMFDIDAALKAKLQGLRVDDDESGANRREVKVYFRWPKVEVTDQTFPFVTLDLLRFERAADREQRSDGMFLPYTPKGYTPPTDDGQDFLHTWEMPIPYDFTYQIAVHSRSYWHDRQISFQILQDERLPTRGAYLAVGDPAVQQQTLRQMFVSGPVNADGMDQVPGGRPKRHFRKIWTATVSAELFQTDIVTLEKVADVVTNLDQDVYVTG